ncbi:MULTISPECIES: MATE family efflux transporter [Spirulina sp. CCY15215]|uniref:MATE family efflux transporter n=1 Tax=Spirulina sp. CCY15215 TaxID=2767591 RepID=UPI0019504545|nr:MATE family efflux transporter [Spirulina major]
MELIQKRSRVILQTEIQNSLTLAIPAILTQLAETAIGFIDLVMMGWLGSEALAAGGLGVITFYTFTYIGTGLFEGLGALVAEAFGREDIEEIRKLTIQGLWLNLIFSLPMMLFLWHLGSILPLLGQEEKIASSVTIYLQAIVWGFPAALGIVLFKGVTIACDRPQFLTIITAISVPLSALANYILIFGHWGFPALGLAGAGWASTIIFGLTFFIILGYLQFHPDFQKYQFFNSLWYGDRHLFSKILKIGIPISIQFGSELGLFLCTSLFMGYLGTANLAAHEITLSIFELAIVIPFGFSYATVVRVGQRLGSNNIESSKNAVLIDLLLNAVITSIIALFIWLFPEQIIAIYLDKSSTNYTEITNISISLLGIAALCQSIYGLHLIAIGALQGLQDALVPMWINLSIYWGIGVGGSYFLAIILNLGTVSIWFALTIAILISTGILIWRFFHILSHPLNLKNNG